MDYPWNGCYLHSPAPVVFHINIFTYRYIKSKFRGQVPLKKSISLFEWCLVSKQDLDEKSLNSRGPGGGDGFGVLHHSRALDLLWFYP